MNMGPAERLFGEESIASAVETLASLSGPDMTSVLLEVMKRREASVTALPRATQANRFTRPAPVSLVDLRRVEDAVLSVVPSDVDLIELAPATPLGSHVALGGSTQHRVVSAVRRVEMAADPTVGLALEVAARRAASDRDTITTLGTVQRITRAQVFEDANSFAHFTIFGLVTAGRDRGSFGFECEAATEHVVTLVAALEACGGADIEVAVTDVTPTGAIRRHLEESLHGAVVVDRGGDLGDYYRIARFGLSCRFGETRYDIGDGGFTSWTADMLSDRKERLCISGLGIDRIAIATS